MHRFRLSLVLALLLPAAGMAVAGPQRPEPPAFEAIDTNEDGLITLGEMDAHRAAHVPADAARPDQAPTGRDGAPPPPDRGELFDTLDQDGDGTLSEAEFAAMKRPGPGRHGGGNGGHGHGPSSAAGQGQPPLE